MRRKTSGKSGKWAVERERCRIESAKPPLPQSDPVPLTGVLSSVMKKLGIENQHLGQLLTDRWTNLVGADVAAHARPGSIDSGVITVFVDSSVWLNELSRFGKDKMLAKIRKSVGAGKIKKITFRLDPDAG